MSVDNTVSKRYDKNQQEYMVIRAYRNVNILYSGNLNQLVQIRYNDRYVSSQPNTIGSTG